jgi:hypothetical protein
MVYVFLGVLGYVRGDGDASVGGLPGRSRLLWGSGLAAPCPTYTHRPHPLINPYNYRLRLARSSIACWLFSLEYFDFQSCTQLRLTCLPWGASVRALEMRIPFIQHGCPRENATRQAHPESDYL